jgi:hypothetical protein
MRFKRFYCPIVILALVLSGGAGAWAQERTTPADDEVQARLGFIESALRSAQPRARTWWYGWIAGYSVGTVASWGLAKAHWNDVKIEGTAPNARTVRDREFAEDMLVGGATFALGVGGLLFSPFTPASAAAKLGRLPEGTPDNRRIKLLRAEELLRRCAKREKEGRGWVTHLLNIGVNAAAGVVTAAAFDRPWTDGLVTFAVGESVSLLNIFTQPRRAIRDLEAYEAGAWGKNGDTGKIGDMIQFSGIGSCPRIFSLNAGPVPGGFTVALRF